jgi:hypothetical protein
MSNAESKRLDCNLYYETLLNENELISASIVMKRLKGVGRQLCGRKHCGISEAG